ncbi:transaldolase [Reinekea blandensis]|uniref:Transaldolase n=1 Tax=Reinekea blandensis MED297 TaxID=314283 RepID=A4BCC1_9GAMM|nr:transaldolase [Reinekea blandensis]EAR10187.1 transaldolase [Reinekea sp. MED297] [Reinekea blandensis MED297]
MSTQLEQLKAMTTVVADTGDIHAIEAYQPEEATTNPSLIYAAAQMPQYQSLIDEAITTARKHNPSDWLNEAMDRLAVNFGIELSKRVPGRVSTEVDARLSFDAEATMQKARKFIQLYEAQGVGRDRILIKIAGTWEGINAAQQLEAEGIQCNVTLIFNLAQAIACAEAGAFLISPFVGRILDWYQASTGETYTAETDPGVRSVATIYQYFKTFGYSTIVMGASFRNLGEIQALAGCDRLTIAPALLKQLSETTDPLPRQLSPETARQDNLSKLDMTETRFRWMMNEDPMATEKLSAGIRAFHEDYQRLKAFVQNRANAS